MADRLHIAHGVLTLDVGGLERIVLDLVRTAGRAGHRTTVVCVERPGTLAPAVEAAGGAVVGLDKLPGRGPETRAKAAGVVAGLRPDVLHTHTVGALWHLGPAARAAGVPVLHTEHINNVGKARGWKAKLKTRMLWHRAARYAGRFCGVSADIARAAGRLGTVPRAKLDVVLNGIDTGLYADPEARRATRAALGIPADAPVVGTVGRLNEVKRQDILLRAVAALGPGHDGVYVLVVGDGPERANLERLADDLGLRPRVRFAGYQSAPERFLPAMDVFALTSRLEGLPLVILEAWAAGLPVVTSAVGGIPKVVADGANGLLFPPDDVPAAAAAVGRVFADPGLWDRLARDGRRTVREHYSLDRMAAEYERRYRELIAARAEAG